MKKCSDLMTLDLRWIPSHASALEAAQVMRESSVGLLPLCDARSGRLLGVVTDRDLVTRLCALDGRPSETPVRAVATNEPVAISEDADVRDAEATMREFQISRIVVVDRAFRPVGILSLTDIMMGERDRRALDTARAVLSREAHMPIEDGALLDAELSPDETNPEPIAPAAEEIYESSTTAVNREGYIIGGHTTREMKEFPR